jgi:hypothetical protein
MHTPPTFPQKLTIHLAADIHARLADMFSQIPTSNRNRFMNEAVRSGVGGLERQFKAAAAKAAKRRD